MIKAKTCSLVSHIATIVLVGQLGLPHGVAALPGHTSAASVVSRVPGAAVDTIDSLTPQLATITTDTGAFAPGRRDFSRYDNPWLCLMAAVATKQLAARTLDAQILRDTLPLDTVGLAPAASIARACGAKFSSDTATGMNQLGLLQLAMFEQNDQLAVAVLNRLATGANRDRYLKNEVALFLSLGRLGAARKVVAHVDALGPSAATIQEGLHDLLRHYGSQEQDTLQVRHEAERVIANGLKRQNVAADHWDVSVGYEDLMALAAQYGTDANVKTVAERAHRDLGQFRLEDQTECRAQPQLWMCADWASMSIDSVIRHLAPGWYTGIHYGGRKAPPLHADTWIPAPGHQLSDTIIPAPGKITLICTAGQINDYPGVYERSNYNRKFYLAIAGRQASDIRKWVTLYGSSGLVVTLVHPNTGSVEVGHDDNFWELFLDTSSVVGFWHWYDQVFHQLPIPIAIQNVVTTAWLPEPDGRRLTDQPPQIANYMFLRDHRYFGEKENETLDIGHTEDWNKNYGVCTVVGRDGTILYTSNGPADPELNDVLHWLFVTQPTQRLASPSTPAHPVPVPRSTQS